MTEEFDKSLFGWGGTPVATCNCGRIHYVANGENMDDGELADLERKRGEDKKGIYVRRSEGDSVGIIEVGGVVHVWGCECGSLDKIENFLWSNRDWIIRYYKARTTREQKEASAISNNLEGI